MTITCPSGHTSVADDYCDVCGAPIDHQAASPSVPSSPAPEEGEARVQPCPNCSAENSADALFCEACGYDFTTGTMPRSLAPLAEIANDTPQVKADFEWVAEIWIDPDWYKVQDSSESMPSPGLPEVFALRKNSILIGRTSHSRNINPDITCEADTGISRRQAQLTSDGTRWWVEDLESANGTYVGPASGPLPTDPIPVGPKRELHADDRIYLGAWTRIVIRQATEDELKTL